MKELIPKFEQIEGNRSGELQVLVGIVDISSDATIICDDQERIIFINPAYERLTGYKAKELLGKTPRVLKSGAHNKAHYKKMWADLNAGKTHSALFCNKKKNGKLYWVEKKIMPIRNAQGKTTRFICTDKDISERMQLEEKLLISKSSLTTAHNELAGSLQQKKLLSDELKISKNKLFSIFDTAVDGIVYTSRRGKVLDVNGSFLKITGLTREEVIGKSGASLARKFVKAKYLPMILKRIAMAISGKPWTGNFELEFRGKVLEIGTTNRGTERNYIAILRDITEQKKLMEALTKERDKFNFILNKIPIGITVLNENDEYTYINPASQKIDQGCTSRYNLPNQNVRINHPKKALPKIEQLLKDFKSGKSSTYLRVTRRGKSDVEIYYHALRSEEGKYQGTIRLMSNITERKKMEEALRSGEEKYRLMFENMINGFAYHKIITDKNGKPIDYTFLEANLGFEQLTGLKRKDILGKNVKEVLPGIENDPTDWIGRYGKVALEGGEIHFESFAEALNKSFSVYAYCPHPGYFAVIFEDITDRKMAEETLRESEEQHRTLVHSLTDSVISMDHNMNIVLLNPAAENMFGYFGEEIIGKSIEIIIPQKYWKLHKRGVKTFLKTEKTNIIGKTVEVEALKKGGELIPIELSLSAVKVAGAYTFTGVIRDISERKKAEIALEESEKKFATLFNSSKDAVMTLSPPNWTFTSGNPSALKMFGFKSEKDFILSGPDQLSPKYQPDGKLSSVKAKAKIEEAMKKGHLLFEWVHKRISGEEFSATVLLSRLTINHKTFLQATVRDITEQKKAEAELKKLSTAIEQSPVSIVITNLEGNIEYVNPKFERVTGYSAKEVLGKNPRILKSGNKGAIEYKTLWENITSGKTWTGEFHNKKKNGRLFWEHASIGPVLNEKGDITHFMAIKEDVTEKKKAEQLLRRSDEILHEISSVVLLINNKGNIVFVSPSIKKLTGYDPGEIMGNNWWKRSFINEKEGLQRKKTMVAYANDPSQSQMEPYKRKIKCKDGSVKWFEWYHSKGAEDSAIGVGQDITLRMEAEKKLLDKTKELEMFFYRSAHDLRAPFTTAEGLINLIKQEKNNSEVTTYVGMLSKTLKNARDLIDSLSLASMVSKKTMKLQAIDFGNLIENMLGTLRSTPNFDKINFQVKINTPVDFKSSVELLNAVLQNLLQNAINYQAPERGKVKPCIKIEVKGTKTGVRLSVQDNGLGIAQDQIGKIFNMYHRANTVVHGTGLGLYIVKNAVENLGGKINLTSKLGQGTRFVIILPYQNG